MNPRLKNIYNALPFKQPLFNLIKKVGVPHPDIYKHLYFKGIIPIKVNENVKFLMHHHGFQLENELYWNGLTGGWEKISLGLWIKLCTSSSVIFDVGANTGIYSLIASALQLKATVVAFEPVNRVYKKLVANNELNKFSIHCVEKAASDFNGTATIYDTDADHTYSVAVNKDLTVEGTKTIQTQITTVTLDTFVKEQKIAKVDLIKIDVETHEPAVIAGFIEHIKQHKPTLLIEILNDEVGEKVNSLIDGLGYCFYNIDENKGIRKVARIRKSDFHNFLVCSAETATRLGL